MRVVVVAVVVAAAAAATATAEGALVVVAEVGVAEGTDTKAPGRLASVTATLTRWEGP